jgi:hypothetical protein
MSSDPIGDGRQERVVAGLSADRRVWARMVRRALRWRRASSFAMVVVAIVSIAGSTAGPVYLRSADDSTVTSALQQAPLGATDVQFSAPPGGLGGASCRA